MNFVIRIRGHVLEYVEATHTYLVDGIIVPSVTGILERRFGGKYAGIDKAVLKKAADRGTAVHAAIEDYCVRGQECALPELRNFRFLQEQFGFHVLANEVPVILFRDNTPIAAGRLDMVLRSRDRWTGLADIKRTATLDKEYVGFQLNIYRIAYQQSYGEEINFLRALHLRNDVRRYVELPINEEMTWELINEYFKERENDEQDDFDWAFN